METLKEQFETVMPKQRFVPTQVLLKDLFDYHVDGYLIWKKLPVHKTRFLGKRAGCISKDRKGDRWMTCIKHTPFAVSRLIFLWHHGYLPEIVDHENRNTLDDRIENLRAATPTENCQNRTHRKNSKSIYRGITMRPSGHWAVTLWHNGVKYLGTYKTQEEAALVYNKGAARYHKEFAVLNIILPPMPQN